MTRLRYISADESGYSRKKSGRGFTYLDTEGQRINDTELRDWIESIAIPPAWTDVWISPYKNGHILATGRDDKGRKQYVYHPDWQAVHNQKKFDRLLEFSACLPHIRKITEEHLRQRKLTRERVLATIVRLLESTLIRIGNEEYAAKNDSYGLTTLTDNHAKIKGSRIVFDFVGKSGKEHEIVLQDKRLARIVKQCQDIPGYPLFQYYGEDGESYTVDSADVNAYLHDITGQEFTAKVFRTWGGSTLAIKYLCEQCSETNSKAASRACVAHVAELLGNTKAVCKAYYIHPLILDAHEQANLKILYEKYKSKNSPGCDLTPEEETLVALLKQHS